MVRFGLALNLLLLVRFAVVAPVTAGAAVVYSEGEDYEDDQQHQDDAAGADDAEERRRLRGTSRITKSLITTGAKFCWRDGRELRQDAMDMINNISPRIKPTTCDTGRELRSEWFSGIESCYKLCPAGYDTTSQNGCKQQCPAGWRDDIDYCRKEEYSRGAGYAWQFGDWAFNFDQARDRCQQYGQVCEQYGGPAGLWFPKCRSGYYVATANICRPNPFSCAAEGMGHQIDISCAKKIIGADSVPAKCADPAKENLKQMCITPCKFAMHGEEYSPYTHAPSQLWCEPNAPETVSSAGQPWVQCGVQGKDGYAMNDFVCASTIGEMTFTVGMTLFNIATMGLGTAPSKVALAAKFAKDPKTWRMFKEAVKKGIDDPLFHSVLERAGKKIAVVTAKQKVHSISNSQAPSLADVVSRGFTGIEDPDDMAFIALTVGELVDPTGIMSLISVFRKPACSTIESILPEDKVKGYLDKITYAQVSGWLCDQADPTAAIAVHVFAGGPMGGPLLANTMVGFTQTSESSESAINSQCKGGTQHRFTAMLIPLPTRGDGNLYVYGLAANGDATRNLAFITTLPQERCGPDHGNHVCDWDNSPFCSSLSYCGDTQAHQVDCQASYSKQGMCQERCGPDHGNHVCARDVEPFCSSLSYCGDTQAHQDNCQSSYSKQGRCY